MFLNDKRTMKQNFDCFLYVVICNFIYMLVLLLTFWNWTFHLFAKTSLVLWVTDSLQYIPHMIKSWGGMIQRLAVLFTVAIVWGYAEVLTLAGAYDKRSPNTQFSCRTDRSGLISAAPWWAYTLKPKCNFHQFISCWIISISICRSMLFNIVFVNSLLWTLANVSSGTLVFLR